MFRPFPFLSFFGRYPALFCGLFFFLGCLAALSENRLWLLPLLALWTPFGILIFLFQSKKALHVWLLSLALFSTAWIYTASHVEKPPLPPEGLQGEGQMVISKIYEKSTPFNKQWVYEGELKNFLQAGASFPIAAKLPCTIILKVKEPEGVRPKADCDYRLEGLLKLDKNGNYQLKIGKNSIWHPVTGSWSFAEARFSWKRGLASWIDAHISSPSSSSFLKGLLTGEFDDYWMKKQFGRFGLQHLLAISGFHFAIIASFLAFICRFVYPRRYFSLKWPIVTLLIAISGYAFFLGGEPSILRSWFMCSLALLGAFFEKRHSSLNAIGAASLLILAYHPLFAIHLGFQLSFAITLTILILFPQILKGFYWLFPKRPLSHLQPMNLLNQMGYCLLVFFIQTLALNVVVSLTAMPLTLYYFQKFPWMSLVYNLFFPFLASFSLLLLLAAATLFFLPPLSSLIHHVNDSYTFYLLQLTYQAPTTLDAYLVANSPFPLGITIYFSLLLSIAIAAQEKSVLEEDSSLHFHFI